MAVPAALQLSSRDVASLVVIGIYILIIGIMWNAPVLKSILYPFKVISSPTPHCFLWQWQLQLAQPELDEHWCRC